MVRSLRKNSEAARACGAFRLVSYFSFVPVAHAQLGNISTVNGFVSKVLCPIVGAMFSVLMVLSSIMVLYGAYTYLTAAGDAEKVSKATKTITYAAVAVVVALIAKNFPFIVATFFGTTLGPGC